MILSGYFIEAQVYTIAHNKLMQDNNSATLLENNVKFSSSKNTNHIKTRYLFVIEIVEQGDL